jgi:hypothetical protein
VEHLSQAQEIAPVVAVQNRYGVDYGRVNDAMLAACGEQGIAFVPFFALTGTGREVGGLTHSDPVETIARDHGATPAQIRIAWTLSQGPHVLAIPGTGNLGFHWVRRPERRRAQVAQCPCRTWGSVRPWLVARGDFLGLRRGSFPIRR